MRKIFGFQIGCKITNFFITKSGILKVNLKLNGVFQKTRIGKNFKQAEKLGNFFDQL